MNLARIAAIVSIGSLLAACSSNPKRSFEIRTINSEGQQIPCAVMINGVEHPDPDDSSKVLITNQSGKNVSLEFKPDPSTTSGYERHRLGVRALKKTNGKYDPNSWKDLASATYLMADSADRQLRHNDPEIHLFILRLNPGDD